MTKQGLNICACSVLKSCLTFEFHHITTIAMHDYVLCFRETSCTRLFKEQPFLTLKDITSSLDCSFFVVVVVVAFFGGEGGNFT